MDVLLGAGARLLVLDDRRERGYALVEDGRPVIVAATGTSAAVALLRAVLTQSADRAVSIQVLRADQQWAIDVAHRAGLGLQPTGPLCRMGDTGALAPYLPHTGVL
jgi:hypothetical protein